MPNLKKLGTLLARLHRDEGGAETVEVVLLIGFIALPLLGIIIYFREALSEWVRGLWEAKKEEAEGGAAGNSGYFD